MNEAKTLQAMAMPSWQPNEVRLVHLTFVSNAEGIQRCQTLAASLDEAVKRARRHYGPGDLNAWGTRKLPIDGGLVGGGKLLRGKRDVDHTDSLINIYP
nr:hypothetical protein [uncultured Mediterranean phage uvMED]BAR22901.1 hypothetical protein [uncultured Mediterranean phage uvMED]